MYADSQEFTDMEYGENTKLGASNFVCIIYIAMHSDNSTPYNISPFI